MSSLNSDRSQNPSAAQRFWHVIQRGRQEELSERELVERYRVGHLQGSTMVWREGMPEWTALETVRELLDMVEPVAEPPSLLEALLDEVSEDEATVLQESPLAVRDTVEQLLDTGEVGAFRAEASSAGALPHADLADADDEDETRLFDPAYAKGFSHPGPARRSTDEDETRLFAPAHHKGVRRSEPGVRSTDEDETRLFAPAHHNKGVRRSEPGVRSADEDETRLYHQLPVRPLRGAASAGYSPSARAGNVEQTSEPPTIRPPAGTTPAHRGEAKPNRVSEASRAPSGGANEPSEANAAIAAWGREKATEEQGPLAMRSSPAMPPVRAPRLAGDLGPATGGFSPPQSAQHRISNRTEASSPNPSPRRTPPPSPRRAGRAAARPSGREDGSGNAGTGVFSEVATAPRAAGQALSAEVPPAGKAAGHASSAEVPPAAGKAAGHASSAEVPPAAGKAAGQASSAEVPPAAAKAAGQASSAEVPSAGKVAGQASSAEVPSAGKVAGQASSAVAHPPHAPPPRRGEPSFDNRPAVSVDSGHDFEDVSGNSRPQRISKTSPALRAMGEYRKLPPQDALYDEVSGIQHETLTVVRQHLRDVQRRYRRVVVVAALGVAAAAAVATAVVIGSRGRSESSSPDKLVQPVSPRDTGRVEAMNEHAAISPQGSSDEALPAPSALDEHIEAVPGPGTARAREPRASAAVRSVNVKLPVVSPAPPREPQEDSRAATAAATGTTAKSQAVQEPSASAPSDSAADRSAFLEQLETRTQPNRVNKPPSKPAEVRQPPPPSTSSWNVRDPGF